MKVYFISNYPSTEKCHTRLLMNIADDWRRQYNWIEALCILMLCTSLYIVQAVEIKYQLVQAACRCCNLYKMVAKRSNFSRS